MQETLTDRMLHAASRRAGLLEVMDEVTELGRSVHKAGGVLPPNA